MSGLLASNLYGTAPVFIPAVSPQVAMSATDDAPNGGLRGLVDPRNPLLWFGVLLLVTVGAAGAAGSVKLGPGKVSGSIGSA